MEEPETTEPQTTEPKITTVRKTQFIKSIQPGDRDQFDYFQVVEARVSESKDKRPYMALKLSDKTGQIEARMWDLEATTPMPKPGQVVRAHYDGATYKDEPQLKIRQLRLLRPDERFALEDYLPVAARDREEMMQDLGNWIEQIADDNLRSTVLWIKRAMHNQLRDAPAAKSKHQPYVGGLVEHILQLVAVAHDVCNKYPQLNRDVLMAGLIMHDIGKIKELRYDTMIDYTRTGSLAGHIIIGASIWWHYSAGVDPVTRAHVEHIIVSHHGQLKWGSPKVPMTIEAHVAHCIDYLDAGIGVIEGMIAKGVDERGMTGWDRNMETRFWDGLKDEERAQKGSA